MIDWFYSDPHFGHKAIIDLCGRPYTEVDEMNASLVNRYNRTVAPEDFVLWVGDAFLMNFEGSKKILDSLNGRKALVIGNHDRSAGKMVEMGFEFVVDEMTLRLAEHTVRVSHYPYAGDCKYTDGRYPERRPKRVKGQALIHGHTHSKTQRIGTAIHVGVDAHNFAPVSMKRVTALVWEAFA